jgi:superfamily II DNA/RNA helicase
VLLASHTGSGKTLAYLLPLVRPAAHAEYYVITSNQPSCTMCHRHWLPVTTRQC